MVFIHKNQILIFSLLINYSIAIAQQSISPIYTSAKDHINSLEGLEYEIDHVRISILTKSESRESPIYNFDKSFMYILSVQGTNNINSLNIELFKWDDNDWERINLDETPIINNNTSYSFQPSESDNYMIEVIAEEFEDNKSTGRYFFIIGNKKIVESKEVLKTITLNTRQWEEIEYNVLTKKTKSKDRSSFISTFSFENNEISHQYNSNTKKYTITEGASSEEDNRKGLVIYRLVDVTGEKYKMTISAIDQTIELMNVTLKDNKSLIIKKYYYSTDH